MGGELAGGRHQRTQQRDHLGSRAMLHDQHVGCDLLPAARFIGRAYVGIGLGLGGRDNLGNAETFDRREALGLERGEEDLIGSTARYGFGGNDGDLSLHAGVEQEIAFGHLRDCLDHALNVRVLEIQQDLIRLKRRRGGGTLRGWSLRRNRSLRHRPRRGCLLRGGQRCIGAFRRCCGRFVLCTGGHHDQRADSEDKEA